MDGGMEGGMDGVNYGAGTYSMEWVINRKP